MITQIYEAISKNEAKALVSAGVDFVGVVVGLQDGFSGVLTPKQAAPVLTGISGKSKKVVLAFSSNIHEIAQIAKQTKPDILHIATDPEIVEVHDIQTLKLQFPNVKIMRTIPVVDENSINVAKAYDGIVDYLLLDSRNKKNNRIGITGETHDWNISKKIVEAVSVPVILAGGLGPDNVAVAILKVRPFGVDSKTKTDKNEANEKDIEKVKEFIKIAKAYS